MRTDWTSKPLGDICNVVGGGTPSKRNPAFYEGDIPWATVRDMREEVLSRTEFNISPEAVKSSATNVISSGNVVIATRVGLGKVCLLSQATAINQDLRGIIPKSNNLDVRFLFRWLQSVSHIIQAEGTGATVKGVKLPFVKSLSMPLPPLPEQKRIVAILDEVFAGIATAVANTEKNLTNARELFESYLHSVFNLGRHDWQKRKLGEVTNVQSGGTPLRSKPEYWNGDIPWYASGELNDLTTSDPARYITKAGLENSNAKVFPRGSLLIGMYDTAALKMAMLNRDAAFNQAIAAASPDESLDLRFVFFAINAAKSSLLLERRGVRQKNLSLGKIKSIQLPVPSLKEQRRVADMLLSLVDDIGRLESVGRTKLGALAELKQSLLQKAFSGELTAGKEASDAIRKVEEVA